MASSASVSLEIFLLETFNLCGFEDPHFYKVREDISVAWKKFFTHSFPWIFKMLKFSAVDHKINTTHNPIEDHPKKSVDSLCSSDR